MDRSEIRKVQEDAWIMMFPQLCCFFNWIPQISNTLPYPAEKNWTYNNDGITVKHEYGLVLIFITVVNM